MFVQFADWNHLLDCVHDTAENKIFYKYKNISANSRT